MENIILNISPNELTSLFIMTLDKLQNSLELIEVQSKELKKEKEFSGSYTKLLKEEIEFHKKNFQQLNEKHQILIKQNEKHINDYNSLDKEYTQYTVETKQKIKELEDKVFNLTPHPTNQIWEIKKDEK